MFFYVHAHDHVYVQDVHMVLLVVVVVVFEFFLRALASYSLKTKVVTHSHTLPRTLMCLTQSKCVFLMAGDFFKKTHPGVPPGEI